MLVYQNYYNHVKLDIIEMFDFINSLTVYPLIFNKIQSRVQNRFKSYANNENLYLNY